MNKQLQRILDLVRKTGDRMVITDPNGSDVYVLMGLEAYEALVEGGVRQPVNTPLPKEEQDATPAAEDASGTVRHVVPPPPEPKLVEEPPIPEFTGAENPQQTGGQDDLDDPDETQFYLEPVE